MGYEHGTLFIYNRRLWFFEGYSTNVNMQQTLKLRGVDNDQVEAPEKECYFLLYPSEIDYEELERIKENA